MKLSELSLGEVATIVRFDDDDLALKLMEMGCLPGEDVKMEHIAPFGDPIAIRVCGYLLSLRLSEADAVILKQF